MPLPSDLMCARIVVQRGCASEERVRECLELQAKNRAVGYDESLHAVLLKRGFLSEDDAKKIERDLALAQFVRAERIFARVCVEKGLITQDAVKEVLQQQKDEGYRQRIGDLLQKRGVLDRAKRDAVAAEQVRRMEEEDQAARRAEIERKPDPTPPTPSHGTPLGDDLAQQGSFRGADAALAAFKRDQRRYSSTDINVPAAVKEGIAIEGYELLDRLGQGTVGVVWKARPKLGGPLVALKVLSPSLTGNPDLLAKFHKAFERASAIDHPVLVRLGQVARSGDLTYYTMEYVEGESLADRVERGGPLNAARARELGRDLARALAHVHGQRVLHGGVRPRNVLLSRDGRTRLTDLIVGRLAPRLSSQHGDSDDARLYLSPEELTGAAGADPRDDIYSFGLVLYYALVGKHAFPDAQPTPRLEGAPDPRDGDPSADAALSAIVVRATQPSRNDRYRDSNELLAEIDPDRGSDRLPRAGLVPAPPPEEIETPSMLARAERTIEISPGAGPDAVERTIAVPAPRGAKIAPAEPAAPSTSTPVLPASSGAPVAPSLSSPAPVAAAPPDVAPGGAPIPAGPKTGRVRRRSLAQPADTRAEDLTGKVVNNRYRILSKLGEGGMGVVYKAEHTVMSKAIAFKVLHPSLVKSQESMARFQREVLAMAQFAHRNVVRIYDAGKTEDGRFYIAMEFVEGRDLATVLEKEGALPPARTVNILRQVLKAVAEGHAKGIVHRDLKPENILLSGAATGEDTVKVMDFGIAKIVEAEGSTQKADGDAINAFRTLDRVVLGTPEYMSPEQASGSAIDHRSDLYSLGCIAYEMLLGRLPFDADSPVGFIGKHIVDPPLPFEEAHPGHGIAPSIESFVMKALEKDPDERFQSADEMLKALEAAAPREVQAAIELSNRLKATRAPTPSPLEATGKSQEPPVPPPAPPSESGTAPSQRPVRGKTGRIVPAAVLSDETQIKKTGSILPLVVGAGVFALVCAVGLVVLVKVLSKDPIEKRLAAAKLVSDPAAAKGDWDEAKRPYKVLLENASGSERAEIEAELGKVAVRETEATKIALRKKDFEDAVAAARKLLPSEEASSEAPLQVAIDKARAAMGSGDAATVAELEAKQRDWKMRFEERLGLKLAKDPTSLESALDHLRAARERAITDADRQRLDARIAEVDGDRHFHEAGRLLAAGRFDEAASEARKALDASSTSERKDLVDEIEKQRGLADLATRRKAVESAASDGDAHDSKERYADAQKCYEAALAEARRSPQLEPAAKQLEEKIASVKAKIEALAAFDKLPPVPAKDAPDAVQREAIDRRRDYAKAFPDGPRTKTALDEAASIEVNAAGTVVGKARVERQIAIDAARAALADEKEDAARAALEKAKKAQSSLPASEAAPVAKLEGELEAHFGVSRSLRKDFVLVPRGKRPAGWAGADLPPFYMGKFEVTNVDYWKFCQAVARSGGKPRWPDGWEADSEGRMFPAGKHSHPVTNVSFEDAQAYCAWLTAGAVSKGQKLRYRLPHEVEWERAARGDDARRWPWGDEFKEDKVRWWKQQDGKASDGPAPENESAWGGGASPFGAIHMAGNVAEWIDDPFEDDTGTKVAGTKILKGGSFRSSRAELLQATGPLSRKKAEPGDRSEDAGFRVLAEFVKD